MVHRVAQSWTRLKQLSTHAQALILIVIPFGRQQRRPQTGSIPSKIIQLVRHSAGIQTEVQKT